MKGAVLLFATAQGMLKQVEGSEFDVAKRTIAATKLQEGDEVVSIADMKGIEQLALQTRQGFFLRFQAEEVPYKKKGAVGVRGIRLGEEDVLEAVHYLDASFEGTAVYKEKEICLKRLRIGKRDTKGTKTRV